MPASFANHRTTRCRLANSELPIRLTRLFIKELSTRFARTTTFYYVLFVKARQSVLLECSSAALLSHWRSNAVASIFWHC